VLQIYDRKEDYKVLVKDPDFVYIPWQLFYDNPLKPPPNYGPEIWASYFTEIWGNVFGVFVGTRTFIQDKMIYLYKKYGYKGGDSPCPTPVDLLNLFMSLNYPLLSRFARYLESAINEFRGTVGILGDAVSGKYQVRYERLAEVSFGISLLGLPTEFQNLIISWTAAKMMLYMMSLGRGGGLKKLIVLDECRPLFKKFWEQKGNYVLTELLVMSREFRLGWCLGSQSLDLAQSVLANTSTKILVGGLGSGTDYDVFARGAGLSIGQMEQLKTRKLPGQSCISRPDYPFAFLFDAPLFPVDKNVNQKLVQTKLDMVFDHLFYKVERPSHNKTNEKRGENSQRDSGLGAEATRKEDATSEEDKPRAHKDISAHSKMVLEFISVSPNCFSHLEEIWHALGITSGSTKMRIKRELFSLTFIREWRLQKGKTYPRWWEITPKGSSYLGKEPLSLHGKGKFLHSAGIHFVCRWGKNHGFDCAVERAVGERMKQVDVVLTKRDTGELVAVEICTSETQKELKNIKQDLAEDTGISKVILLATDASMKRKLEGLIREELELAPFSDRIQVLLIGQFID
jgi:hypothetical protein